ncbi:hypothetical protein V2J09_004901 [Rumex salicifolius]
MSTILCLTNSLLLSILVMFQILSLPCLCFTAFLFGDSLVDAGNNNYLFTLSKANSPPYGIDFAATNGRPTGRFTNGREALGGTSFPPPFLAPNSMDNAVHGGINYASGSAGILPETGTLFIGRISLPEQVDYFEQSRDYMVKILGEEGTLSFLRNAVFSIAIGSNDLIDYIEPSIPILGHPTIDSSTFQRFMISNLTTQLKRMHRLGARKFMVVGVGPLGCIPFVRAIELEFTTLCSASVNELVNGYNERLRHELDSLNTEMDSSAIFVYANSYDVFMDVLLNYRDYGFEDVKDPCCGGHFPSFVCNKGKDTQGYSRTNSSSDLCGDRSKYVFWDAFHPTEAVNIILAEKLLNGDSSVSFPINIRELYRYKLRA